MKLMHPHDSRSPPRAAAALAAPRRRWPQNKVNLGVVDPGGDARLHGRHRLVGQRGQEGTREGSTRT